MRVVQQPAYVLLNRAYGETSWIIEVVTRNHGRLALLAKGGRRPKSSFRGLLLPFQALLVSWTGKGEIPVLTQVELWREPGDDMALQLRADSLACGFYCNELLVRLCHRHDPHPRLFNDYHKTIQSLLRVSCAASGARHTLLRQFECACLKESGYAVNFAFEQDGVTPINTDCFYQYQAQKGFLRVANGETGFSGELLLRMNNEAASLSGALLTQSKLLMRDILHKSFGNKPIVSRELFYSGALTAST